MSQVINNIISQNLLLHRNSPIISMQFLRLTMIRAKVNGIPRIELSRQEERDHRRPPVRLRAQEGRT